MNWTELTQDRDLWHSLVNTVMILHVMSDLEKYFSN
jgi:hypothetical protein